MAKQAVTIIATAIIVVSLSGTAGNSNEANDQLIAAPDEQRRTAFQIILAGAGETCNTVTRTYFQGETAAGDAVWNVDCVNDGSYSISIAKSGNTKLIACRLLQRLDGTECFKPLPQQR
jgi:hypothetical protein